MPRSLVVGLMLLGAAAAAPVPVPGSAQVLVTAHAIVAGQPPLQADTVMVFLGGAPQQVTAVAPQTGPIELYVALDDAAGAELNPQLDAVRDWIRSFPDTTAVGVVYLQQGTAEVAMAPNRDHAVAAQAVRPTGGAAERGSRPFESIAALIAGWKPGPGTRREMLLLSDGVGAAGSAPAAQRAALAAQRAGVVVEVIALPAASQRAPGRGARSAHPQAQRNLHQLAADSGGVMETQPGGDVIRFQKNLQQIADLMLAHQYLVTFTPSAGTQAGWQPLRVRATSNKLAVFAPSAVRVP